MVAVDEWPPVVRVSIGGARSPELARFAGSNTEWGTPPRAPPMETRTTGYDLCRYQEVAIASRGCGLTWGPVWAEDARDGA
jgi:hypothetical protein